MFANDKNLFYSGKDIQSLFSTANNELSNISHWFNSNKLSYSMKLCHGKIIQILLKTKYQKA